MTTKSPLTVTISKTPSLEKYLFFRIIIVITTAKHPEATIMLNREIGHEGDSICGLCCRFCCTSSEQKYYDYTEY